MKNADRHGRDEDREIEAEGPDQEQHDQHRHEVRALPHIADPFGEAALTRWAARVRTKLGDAQAGEGNKHRGEGRAVDQEGPARADRGDGQAGDGRADHPGGVERGRVERHGIVQVGIADQFRDESLAHRRIEGGGAAEQEGEDVDVPELRRRR